MLKNRSIFSVNAKKKLKIFHLCMLSILLYFVVFLFLEKTFHKNQFHLEMPQKCAITLLAFELFSLYFLLSVVGFPGLNI